MGLGITLTVRAPHPTVTPTRPKPPPPGQPSPVQPGLSRPARQRLRERLDALARRVAAVAHPQHGPPSRETIHQLRVTARRADAAVFALRGRLGSIDCRALRAALRFCRRDAGGVRDLDILLDEFEAAKAPKRTRRLIEAMRAWKLHEFRLELNRSGVEAVLRAARRALARPAGPAGDFAAEATAAFTHALARVRRADAQRAPVVDKLHELRRRLKRLRFTIEFFDEALDPWTTGVGLMALRALLDALGAMCDAAALAARPPFLARPKTRRDQRSGPGLAQRVAAARAAWLSFKRRGMLKSMEQRLEPSPAAPRSPYPSAKRPRAGSSVG